MPVDCVRTMKPHRGGLVPGEGIEPSWAFARRILSAVRIPFRHPGTGNDAMLRRS